MTISIDETLLRKIDRLVDEGAFTTRSQAIQIAVAEKLDRLGAGRLARECAKLDPATEQALADEGLDQDAEKWPEY